MFNISQLAQHLYDRTVSESNYFWHKSIIVVGNNSTGKSKLLKELLDKVIENERTDFYYIDSKNRVVIDRLNENLSIQYSSFDVGTIVRARCDSANFSKLDVFDERYSGGVVTFSELMSNLEKYNELLDYFMSWTLERGNLLKKESFIGGCNTLLINGEIDIESISSSEAAKIRLLMEIDYANTKRCRVVIIDEFDEYFDIENMLSFMRSLVDYYSGMRFVFVVHNFELLVRISDMDAVIYNNEKTASAEILPLDCNDITQLGQIHKIRSRYIGEKDNTEQFLSECISELLKYGVCSQKNKKQLVQLNRNLLKSKEKILYDYIEEYSKNEN